MKKLLGVVLAAAVYFIWGMVSWMVLPIYDQTMKTLPEEQLIRDTLKIVVQEPGLYYFPGHTDENGEAMDMEMVAEKSRTGPVGIMSIVPQGAETNMARGCIVNFIYSLMVAWFLLWLFGLTGGCIKTLGWRMILATKIGVVAWLVRDIPHWNWFHFPMGYTLVNLFYLVVGFALMGLVLHFFMPKEG